MINDERASRQRRRRIPTMAAWTLILSACASAGVGSGSTTTATATSAGEIGQPDQGWTTVTREYVDLWLHGYAMLTSDTARVPYFQRGYRQHMLDLKRRSSAVTSLDANRDRLSARFTANPALVNGQFVAMYFPSLQEIVNATNWFIQAQGDPRRSNDPTTQAEIAVLAANFPSPADRDWLRLFVQALQDESNRFYHAYWTSEQQGRAAARTEIESRWRTEYYPKFRRFLNNTQQAAGDLILSLPLDGEGRTVSDGKRANAVAVAFPENQSTAVEAIYVFAHEVVNKVTETAISDNTTPAEQRSGVVAAYTANATVRGGAMLLQKIAPELVPGYMRHYLRSAGASAPGGDPTTTFTSTFRLPDAIRDAIARQIEVVLGGI